MACCFVPVAFFTIPIFTLAILSLMSLQEGLPFFQAVQGWTNDALRDIRAQAPGTPCQPNVELIEYKFSGLKPGCDCTDTNGLVYNTTCSSSQNSCRRVERKDAKVFSNWNTGSKNVRLCGVPITGYNFFKKYPLNGKCSASNDRLCGGPDINFGLCVDKNLPCPITGISPKKDTLHSQKSLFTEYYFSRERENTNPSSQFRVSEGHICLENIDDPSIPAGQVDYPLLNKPSKSCTTPAENFIVSDTDPDYFFFAANDPELVLLPGFVNPKNFKTMTMYQRPYVFWRDECRGGGQMDKIYEQTVNLSKIYSSHFAILITAGVLLLYLLIIPVSLCCEMNQGAKCGGCRWCCGCSSCDCCQECWNKQSTQEDCYDYCTLIDPIVYFLYLFHYLTVFALFISSIVVFANSNSYAIFIKDYESQNCSTPQMNDSIQEFSESVHTKLLGYQKTIISLCVILFVMETITLLVLWCGNIKMRRQFYQKAVQAQVKIPRSQSLNEEVLDDMAKGQRNALNQELHHINQQPVAGYPVAYPPPQPAYQNYAPPPQNYPVAYAPQPPPPQYAAPNYNQYPPQNPQYNQPYHH